MTRVLDVAGAPQDARLSGNDFDAVDVRRGIRVLLGTLPSYAGLETGHRKQRHARFPGARAEVRRTSGRGRATTRAPCRPHNTASAASARAVAANTSQGSITPGTIRKSGCT